MNRFSMGPVVGALGFLLVGTSTVSATRGTGVSDTILAKGASSTGIVITGRGMTDVTVREMTIAPGGSTGWHYHDGYVIAVVKSGALTRTMHDCSIEVTASGKSFAEPADSHIGRNLGTEPVVLLVIYVLPAGQQLSGDAQQPQCDR